jgi:segregation and condensation protein B
MTVSDDSLRLAEALIFASATPVTFRALTAVLPETEEAEAVIAALRDLYAGRGVELVEVAGGIQFRTAPDLAPRLTRVIEVPRRLPRAAMETLAIKESPGRPTLWATTPAFLTKFGLKSLGDLPRRDDLMNDTALMGTAPPRAEPPMADAPGGAPASPEAEFPKG